MHHYEEYSHRCSCGVCFFIAVLFFSADDKSVAVAGDEKTKEMKVVSNPQPTALNPVPKESADENSLITAEDSKVGELLEKISE